MYVVLKEYALANKYDYTAFYKSFISSIETSNNTKASLEVKQEISKAIEDIKKGIKSFEEGSIAETVYNTFKENKNTFKTNYFTDKYVNNRSKRNNEIFDIQWEVLRHSDTASKMFNPGSFDTQKKAARIITILKDVNNKLTYEELSNKSLSELNKLATSKDKRSMLNPLTQIYLHKQNMIAGKLIGIFANHNTSHGFLSYLDLKLDTDINFTIDGKTIGRDSSFDSMESFDGTLISKNIASFLAASVDAVKDPVLNYLNLNTITANVAMTLIRLGFDTNTVGLIMAHPILERVVFDYNKLNSEGFTTVDSIINNIFKEYKNKGIDADSEVYSLKTFNFTSKELADSYNENSDVMDIMILKLFNDLSEIASDVKDATYLTKFNSMSNAVGPTIADNIISNNKVLNFINRAFTNSTVFNDNIRDIFDKNPIIEAFYDTTVSDKGASKYLFKNHFPHYNEEFLKVLDLIDNNIKSNLTPDLINDLVGAYSYYKMTLGDNPLIDGSLDNRNKFINKLPELINKAKTEVIGNKLLDSITIIKDNKTGKNILDLKSTGLSTSKQDELKNSWGSLIKSDETSDLAKDLVYYNIFRTGFNFSPKSFLHLTSADVKLEFNNYVESLRTLNEESLDFSPQNFLLQYFRNNYDNSRLIPNLGRASKNKSVSFKNISNIESPVLMVNLKHEDANKIILKNTEKGIKTVPFLKYNDELYTLYNNYGTNVAYVKVGKLGLTNNYMEYNGKENGISMSTALHIKENTIESTESTINEATNSNFIEDGTSKYREYSDDKAEKVLSNAKFLAENTDIFDSPDFAIMNSSGNDVKMYHYIVDEIVKLGKVSEGKLKEDLRNIIKDLC